MKCSKWSLVLSDFNSIMLNPYTDSSKSLQDGQILQRCPFLRLLGSFNYVFKSFNCFGWLVALGCCVAFSARAQSSAAVRELVQSLVNQYYYSLFEPSKHRPSTPD